MRAHSRYLACNVDSLPSTVLSSQGPSPEINRPYASRCVDFRRSSSTPGAASTGMFARSLPSLTDCSTGCATRRTVSIQYARSLSLPGTFGSAESLAGTAATAPAVSAFLRKRRLAVFAGCSTVMSKYLISRCISNSRSEIIEELSKTVHLLTIGHHSLVNRWAGKRLQSTLRPICCTTSPDLSIEIKSSKHIFPGLSSRIKLNGGRKCKPEHGVQVFCWSSPSSLHACTCTRRVASVRSPEL